MMIEIAELPYDEHCSPDEQRDLDCSGTSDLTRDGDMKAGRSPSDRRIETANEKNSPKTHRSRILMDEQDFGAAFPEMEKQSVEQNIMIRCVLQACACPDRINYGSRKINQKHSNPRIHAAPAPEFTVSQLKFPRFLKKEKDKTYAKLDQEGYDVL